MLMKATACLRFAPTWVLLLMNITLRSCSAVLRKDMKCIFPQIDCGNGPQVSADIVSPIWPV